MREDQIPALDDVEPVHVDPSRVTVTSSSPPQGRAADGGYCTNCGAKLQPGANFCGNCGQAVGARAAPATTPVQSVPVHRTFAVPIGIEVKGVAWNAGIPTPTKSKDRRKISQAIAVGVAEMRQAGWEPMHPTDIDYLYLDGRLQTEKRNGFRARFEAASVDAASGGGAEPEVPQFTAEYHRDPPTLSGPMKWFLIATAVVVVAGLWGLLALDPGRAAIVAGVAVVVAYPIWFLFLSE